MSNWNDVRLDDILIVQDFPNVFPKYLLGLLLEGEIEFTIELVPWTTLISKVPYRMIPLELRDLKSQHQEMLNKGFTRPSASPLGVRVGKGGIIFVKKKDGTLRL